MDKLQIL